MAIYRGAGGASDSVDDATVNAVAAYAAAAANSATSADASEAAAAASAASAAGSVSSVATYASNAATSAVESAASASLASVSSSEASSFAGNASASATAAASSASDASNSASSADTSEANAATSASSAATSASNAAASAASALEIYGNTTAMNNAVSAAANSAANAATSASSATTSAATATAQAANALSSANAADISEASALTYSNNAATSANNALNSANASAASAASAATSAASASTSATNSASIYGGLSAVNAAVATTTTNANNAATSATNASNSAAQAAASAASASAIVLGVASGMPSIKPTLNLDFANSQTVDPRITFTRTGTAAYYDGKTTVKAEENLLTYSQEFDNASWTKTNASVTANTFAAPDGTTTADTLTATAGNGTVLETFTASAVAYTYSVWLYRKTGTGNVDITVDGTTYSTVAVTAAWTRFSVTTTPSAGSKTAGIRLVTSGDEVYIWGAQLEQRSTVTAYTPTTTQAITNYIPAIQYAPANTPRIDFDPVSGECKGLLIEEQRTNLLTYSEQFDNAAWTKTASSITANAVVAPDGTITADSFVESNTNAIHIIGSASQTVTSGVTYAMSVYAKAGSRSVLQIAPSSSGFGATAYANFDLSTGVVSASAVGTATITNVGNGWFRCTFSVAATLTTTTGPLNLVLQNSPTAVRAASYTGDGYSGIYIWGAQLEAGAFPTSYIPTVASQVTRGADSASMTGVNFSSWYRQDEGTLYADFNVPAANPVLAIGQNSFATSIQINSVNVGRFTGTVPYLLLGTAVVGANKIALALKPEDFSSSTNGASVATSTAAQTIQFGANHLNIGASYSGASTSNGHLKKISYYPKRLSNSELQALTA